MATHDAQTKELKAIGYELFIGALSVLSILNLVLVVVINNPDIDNVVLTMNTIMTPIFLGDFFYRLFTSVPKSAYFWRAFGWADLLSSLPFPQAKVLRFFRLWRVIRLLIRFGARNLALQFVRHRAENALLTVIFLVLCVLQFGALAVLRVEQGAPDSNIKNASDALWWTYVSITTVGYGDRFPTTNPGRIIGLFVLTAGVGLFGTLSGFLANSFLTPPKDADASEATSDHPAEPAASVQKDEAAPPSPLAIETQGQLDEILRLLTAQEQAAGELRRKVIELQAQVEQQAQRAAQAAPTQE